MTDERRRLEQYRRWRQAAVWAPVLWFPVILASFAMGQFRLAIAGILAGVFFAATSSAVIWFGRCPKCAARFGESREAFRIFWDQATCSRCGLSLFELRRRETQADSDSISR